MEEKCKMLCFAKKGGRRDLMTTHRIINFRKWLEAGMRVPSTGADPVLPWERTAAGTGWDTQHPAKNCPHLTPNGLI